MSTFTPEDFGFTFLKDGTSVQDLIDQRIKALSASDAKDAFYVADLGEVVRRYLLWVREIPRVTPFYAVKCNESRPIVMTLAALGTGFDCASKYEMHLITSLGVDPSRIIYANTIKQPSHLKYAVAHGIQKMTFDNEAELIKISQCCENAKLVLRIAVDDSGSMMPMTKKFGAKLERCPALLKQAKKLGLDVIGVSFHVGGYCMTPVAYTKAITNARNVFDLAAKIGYKMTLLDLGGGYPGFSLPNISLFREMAVDINKVLDKYFPVSTGVQIISEPGRFFPSSAYTLAVNIIGKRVDMEKSADDGKEDGANRKTISYYVNDGIHTSFGLVVFPFAYVLPSTHKRSKPGERFYPSTIYGQTCDGHDQIVEDYSLPEAQEGEWMLFYHMGAYTVSTMTNFNGFPKPETQFVMTRKAWQRLLQIAAAKGDQALLQQPSPHDEPDACCPVKPGLARKHNLTGKEGK
ncbi:ornithine decarboxylase 1-like [Conger conger]|uniref:ornithine decarboxylase 1-like n=1 Tax=Conger conger TaxID=82655 RepID=UPI002A5B0FC8|nr:ornithine decarboxylase 1-like [Conger conger]